MPDTSPDAEIVAHKNIPYADGSPLQRLDVHCRPDAHDAPVLVQVHGGAWSSGSKDNHNDKLITEMAERGWVCVSIDYRLAPADPWPAQIVDVKRALAWVSAHIAEHGGDPGYVALTGASAGGHLATLAALTPGEWQPGFEDAATEVAACVSFYGVYDLVGDDGDEHTIAVREHGLRGNVFPAEATLDDFRAASPLHRITPESPDLMVLHGDRDTYVPIRQAEAFVARLRAVSRSDVRYREVTGSGHMFDDYGSARARDAQTAVREWLEEHHARTRPHTTTS